MTAPVPKHVSGEQVRLALLEARPGGLTRTQLCHLTGLTPSQVANGIVWIRETAASQHLTPLTWTARDGYRFSDDPLDWISFEISATRRALTMMSRLFSGTVDPHRAKRPREAFARMMISNVQSVLDTYTFIIEQQPDQAGAS